MNPEKTPRRRPAVTSLVALLTVIACSEPNATDRLPALVECPTTTTESETTLTGILGGIIEVAGSSITVPAGALLLPTQITLTVPASRYMEVEATANDLDIFEFESPVTVVIDYSRCTDPGLDDATLTAWRIDTETKALIENMGGEDDKDARTITFSTDHFSSYAIAE